MLECYPVVRLCDVPSHGSERAVETLSEHADHLAAAGRMPSLPRRQRVGGDAAAEGARGATELLCSSTSTRRAAAARDGDEGEPWIWLSDLYRITSTHADGTFPSASPIASM